MNIAVRRCKFRMSDFLSNLLQSWNKNSKSYSAKKHWKQKSRYGKPHFRIGFPCASLKIEVCDFNYSWNIVYIGIQCRDYQQDTCYKCHFSNKLHFTGCQQHTQENKLDKGSRMARYRSGARKLHKVTQKNKGTQNLNSQNISNSPVH